MPATVAAEIASGGLSPTLYEHAVEDLQMVHIFATSRCDLASTLAEARQALAPDGVIWISWPKKASGKPTDLSDETIRAEAFPLGLVDVKVCVRPEAGHPQGKPPFMTQLEPQRRFGAYMLQVSDFKTSVTLRSENAVRRTD